MQISNDLLKEKNLIYERISDDEKTIFNQFFSLYDNEDDLKTMLIRYRHYLKDIYDSNWGRIVYKPLGRPIKIGYLLNSDVLFYSELDDVICNYLRNEGAEVIQFKLDDIQLKISSNGLEIYISNELVNFDGFLSYGYRNSFNMKSYITLVKFMEQKGIVCLHSHYHEIILNDKMLQSTHYAASNVPIPDTFQVFGIASAKDLAFSKLAETNIIKCLADYGGDSVFKVEDKWNVVNSVAKHMWKGEHVLIQKMIPDSLGESVRVLCIEGKSFAMMKYVDGTGDFRSNVNTGDKFKCVSLMNDPNYSKYKETAEKAIRSIGDILIGGVDILDSPSKGLVVLEINSWPDVYDIWFNTKQCSFKKLAEAFINKIKRSIEQN